ncbi:MAG: hypothetical protein H8D45_26745 [Bacteroidetes bacterium]|nr:hypothetical protein [Bacteroidota bacterium]MBL7104014.1 hypothetical protein [Bacteroidales bacterium]
MKKIKILILVIAGAALMYACNSNSKADTWSEEQKDKWKTNCMEFMSANNVEKNAAAGFCDCMFKKTSEKYTPGEAANITEEEERKLWEECDYSW